MYDKKQSLEYFISEKDPYVVVAFIGQFTKTSAPIIERCMQEIHETKAPYVILSFRDVSGFEYPAGAALVRLEKEVRDAQRKLRLASVRPDLKNLLIERGVVREPELSNNLAVAIQSFKEGA